MTSHPDWVQALRALEEIGNGMFAAGDILTLWLDGEIRLDDVAVALEGAMLGVSEIDGKAGRQCRLWVPARVNSLARALGDTYWTTLCKAPAAIAVSKVGTVRLRDVRYSAVVIDVGAWRAWWAKNRGAEALAADGTAAGQLKSFVERIERLEEEKRTISDDIKDVYAEAKVNGYDTKVLRQVIRIRKQDPAERAEAEALLELYLQALGMGFGSA